MRKLILTAAFVAAMFSAKAQNVTAKCGCDTEKKVWTYSRTDSTEMLQSLSEKRFFLLDWKNERVLTEEGEYPIRYQTSAETPSVTVWFGGSRLVLFYDAKSRYVGHQWH